MRYSLLNNFFKAIKCTATDKQNICGIDLQKFLLRMLSTSLGGDRCNSSFHNFQQSLLNAFPGYIAGNGRIVSLAGNLVYLVYIDNATLGALNGAIPTP